jgi:hypothetical protein
MSKILRVLTSFSSLTLIENSKTVGSFNSNYWVLAKIFFSKNTTLLEEQKLTTKYEKEFRKFSKWIPKDFRKNSEGIPKDFQKNSRRNLKELLLG